MAVERLVGDDGEGIGTVCKQVAVDGLELKRRGKEREGAPQAPTAIILVARLAF